MTIIHVFPATMDKPMRRTSIGVVVFMITIAVILLSWGTFTPGMPGLALIGSGALGFIILFGCWLFRPLGYTLTSEGLVLNRPLSPTTIPWAEIEAVEKEDQLGIFTLIRTCGVGGLFGYFGYFYRSREGSLFAYATRIDQVVWVRRRGKMPLLISPDDPESFLAACSERIS